jgi:peptide/nickel transport system substrate-binding protein
MSGSEARKVKREDFLRGTAGLAAAGTGMGLLVPSALARGQIKRGGVLHYVYTDTSAAETTDPSSQTGIAVSMVALQNSHERLTYVVPNTWQVLPQLAVSWKASPDAKVWTFKLRKGVKFHNGKTFDSKDVQWTFRRILDKKVGSTSYGRVSQVLDASGIKTPKSDTVVFRLKKPDAQFPIVVGLFQQGIVPNGLDAKKSGVGTGPFIIKSWKPTLGWQMVRNPNYWRKGIPYLDGIQGVFIADPNSKVTAVASGSGQISDRIPFQQVPSLRKNKALRLYTLAGGAAANYYFVLDMEPFTDPRVAQAIKIAADRAKIMQAAIIGNGTLTGDILELPQSPFYPPQRGVPKQDIAKAKALLKAAGHGSGLAFTLHTGDVFPGEVEMATALKATVAPAGIDITVQKDPIDTYWSDVWLKVSAATSYWNHRHPKEILGLAYGSTAPWNESHYRSKKLDGLIDAGGATLNPAKQRSIFRSALLDTALNSGVGVSYFINNLHVAKKNVMGVVPDPQYLLKLDQAWLA